MLKKELVYRLHCASLPREQVRQLIFRWIETYYIPDFALSRSA